MGNQFPECFSLDAWSGTDFFDQIARKEVGQVLRKVSPIFVLLGPPILDLPSRNSTHADFCVELAREQQQKGNGFMYLFDGKVKGSVGRLTLPGILQVQALADGLGFPQGNQPVGVEPALITNIPELVTSLQKRMARDKPLIGSTSDALALLDAVAGGLKNN